LRSPLRIGAHHACADLRTLDPPPLIRLPASDQEILDFYRRTLAPESLARHDHTDGWFARYCGDVARFEQGERYLRAVRNALRLSDHDLRDLRILEVGSGFGLTSATLALMGARSVDCIDSSHGMVATMRSYLREFGPGLPVHPQTGFAQALPYQDAQFDLVIVVEALSHILEPRRCAAEVHRVLKPGGRFVIVDDNNALNLRAAAQTREVWDRFENGPPTDDIHGHRVREPYVDRRKRILREAFASMSAADVDRLALRTSYFKREEVLEAGRRFLATGVLPDSVFRSDGCPVEPESGQYIENLIDPLQLTRELDEIGFRTEPEAYFGGESRGGTLLAVNRMLNALIPTELLMKHSFGFSHSRTQDGVSATGVALVVIRSCDERPQPAS
jgi:SAM-dependent methyltransferase